jgi:hypothetical protein
MLQFLKTLTLLSFLFSGVAYGAACIQINDTLIACPGGAAYVLIGNNLATGVDGTTCIRISDTIWHCTEKS